MAPGLGYVKRTWLSGKRMLSRDGSMSSSSCNGEAQLQDEMCACVESDVMRHLLALFDTVLCHSEVYSAKRVSLDMFSIGAVSRGSL